MTLRRGLALAGVLIVVAGAAFALPRLRGLAGGADEVPSWDVESGTFVHRVYTEGNLKAADATVLGPPPEVRRPLKLAWLAQDGSQVAAGDVVIRFDPTELEEQLREGRHDRATTDSQITARRVREQGSRRNLERDAKLADLELDHAMSYQAQDELIFSRRQIVEAEVDQTLAQQRKEHASDAGDAHHQLAQAELDLLTIERRKAELKITQAEEALEALEVRAPHDGIFVVKKVWGRKPEVGQMVWGGNAVAEIPKPETMEAQVYVLEADAGGLEVGLPATVVLEAHPDVAYPAMVGKVAALAQRRDHRVPIQYFTVTLELDSTDTNVMKPGQRVRAEIVLDERPDVLTVPRQAVFEKDGEKIVYVEHGGGWEATEVELGPSSLGRLVIASGLEPGDRIALRDPTRPADAPVESDSDGASPPSTPSRGGRTIRIVG